MTDSLPGEVWASLPDDPGYQVSTFARARSLDRDVPTKTGPQRHRGQPLATPIGSHGYPTICMTGGRKITISRAMLLAFVGPPPFEGAEARHLNDNRLDNRLENLVWGSRQDNAADQERNWRGYVRHIKCPYGHRKVAPNLVASTLPDLACLACNRARSAAYRLRKAGIAVDHQALSDQKYREIMGEEAA